ncbi:MAG TPA: PaaI family thioesterase [Candidatus Poseidoniales archaeon]|jgi:uncharacterized protein (TIGR00369 family)|nr:MAG: hypothetical protein CXT69_06505 [Euryarchaeota archaeon]HIG03806.1 PaaI family thioesterase [Candidatus Poseidoniales archaeon]HIK79110.1 PaaI family thioesterase [Candidatus Poseidoniales archaeon]
MANDETNSATNASPSTSPFSQPPEFSGIAKAMKIEPHSWNQGKVSVQVLVTKEHTNKGGVVHGGLTTMLLDMALGGALVSTLKLEEWCATTALNVNFLDAGQVGDHLISSGRIVRRGRNVAHLAGEVVNQNGRVIASASGTWAIWNKRPSNLPLRKSE